MRSWVAAADTVRVASGSLFILPLKETLEDVCDGFLLGLV